MFTTWLNKIIKVKKTPEKSSTTTLSDYMKDIRDRKAAEKKRKEKWSKEFKKQMNTTKYNSNYKYSTGLGHLPSGTISNSTITTAADAKIRIDGGVNGSMRIDVPLIVNGRDVMKELDEMRDAMLLLKRHVDMEEKYPKLKKIKDEYERALARYTTFDTLKESK